MDIRELKTLLRCQKKYELEKVILHADLQKNRVFEQGLKMLKDSLLQNMTWSNYSNKLESFFQSEYQDKWYDFPWQKNKEIKYRMQAMERMYIWLCSFVAGDIVLDKQYYVEYHNEIADRAISEISLICDILLQDDLKVTAIFLSERFTELLRVKNWEKNLEKELELMIPLYALEKAYPNKEVEIIYVSMISRSDSDDYFSVFDEMPGDNVIRLLGSQVREHKRRNMDDSISSLLKHIKKRGCAGCNYNSICHFPRPVWSYDDSQEEEEKEALLYTSLQQEAIEHIDGPMRVAAGPGAGKTEVLTARISKLIEVGVPPERILAVTFTKKAAKEILARIDSSRKPVVTTLHALGYRIIRNSRHLLGKRKLVNKVDCMKILVHVLKQAPRIRGFDYEHLTGRRGMLNYLFRDFMYINRNGIQKFKEVFPEKDVSGIEVVKTMYDLQYRKAAYIMYEEQISLAVYILQTYPGMRRRMQESFDYLLIDEAQDLDEMQEKLIQLLVGQLNANIAVYGDADQLIYGFRGSSNHFMVQFHELYPEAKDIRLVDNFRSTEEILTASNQLISHNNGRIAFQMKAHVKRRKPPTYIREFHSNRIGRFIEDMRNDGYAAGDIAVIARTNKELRSMCLMVEEYNKMLPPERQIAYDYPKYYLYQDYTFCVLLDLLSAYHGLYTDDRVLYRLLMVQGVIPEKYDKEVGLYDDYLQRNIIYPFDSEEETRYLSIADGKSDVLYAFANIYRAKRYFSLPIAEAVKLAIEAFCGKQVENSDVMEMIEDIIRERSIRNAYELWQYLSAIQKYEDDTRISYQSGYEKRVHFLTAHDSKGKEFPVVLVYGVDLFESNDMEEDRRLLYVAMTRAKERLFLTEECRGKSMLLQEIKDKIEVLEGTRYA